MQKLTFVLFCILCACASRSPTPAISPTTGLEAMEGLFTVYPDTGGARLLAALPPPDSDGVSLRVIYIASLGAGMGSNPVGLDRGKTSEPVILAFRVIGSTVLAVAENHRFIADSSAADERNAVRESFAVSTVWAGPIESETESGELIVDLSSFVARDAFGIAANLKAAKQGQFALEAERSFVDAGQTLVFPDNVEAEALLTFTSSDPGSEVRSTTPVPTELTLKVHHSFVRLPDHAYETRLAHPNMSAVPYPIRDYAAPLDQPIERRLVLRHRLKTNSDGQVIEPIVFYVDRGAPEPIRSALVEGAGWWAEAFEASGFPGGYRVEVLPEGAHPLDARYNVIQWVHRETRGWSYGNPIIDPRTGEIIKGIVSLGSLRLRQDRMIFEGLLGTDKTGSGEVDDPVELALARVRQLAAHEVGHCLGFMHNMAASTNDRASVMDYPAPLIRPAAEDTLDASNAYAAGIGAWDKIAVEYAYREIPEGEDSEAFLATIAQKASAQKLRYVVDLHSRPVGAAHAYGSLWDNGDDPVAMLDETMEVRRIALKNFGLRAIRPGRSVSNLNNVLVPVYLYHRYQLEAAAKLIGGATWGYGNRDEATAIEEVEAETQRDALAALLRTIDPKVLELPDDLVDLLLPDPAGWYDGAPRERLGSQTSPLFDPVQAASTASELTFEALLHPARFARVAEQHRGDPGQLSPAEVLDACTRAIFQKRVDRQSATILDSVADRYAAHLIRLADSLPSPYQDLVDRELETVASAAKRRGLAALAAHIERFRSRSITSPTVAPKPMDVPPGSPIGAGFSRYESGWFDD